MDTLFYWTLGIALVLLAVAGVLLIVTEHKKKRTAESAFRDVGAEKTDQILDLWIDERTRHWLIAHENGATVHTFDQVVCAELTEDGTQYIWQDGEIRSSDGQHTWPSTQAPTAAQGGFFGTAPRVGHIYLNIFTREPKCPVETLVLLTRPSARSSRAYRTAAVRAGALMRLFNTLNDPSESGTDS